MGGLYYPKNNLLLIDGTPIIQQSFLLFLDKIYILDIYKKENSNVFIPIDSNSKKILIDSFINQFLITINSFLLYIKREDIYCNMCVCFSSSFLEEPHEIYNYIDKTIVINQFNIFIKKIQKKYNLYIDDSLKIFKFTDKITTDVAVKGKIHEILNTINFKISKKV